MASGTDSLGARLLEGLKFWTVVAVLCAIAGVGMYYFGRDYVGQHLHEMEVHQRAPEIKPQSAAASVADGEDMTANPPIQPVVTVKEREPTAREERRARRELDAAAADTETEQPAETGKQHDEDAGAEEEEPDEDTEPADSGGGSASDGYLVVAGSFADEANAERQVQRLAERGYQPFITTREKDGITYRRVNVGVFEGREEAEDVQETLTSQGFDAAVWSEG